MNNSIQFASDKLHINQNSFMLKIAMGTYYKEQEQSSL